MCTLFGVFTYNSITADTYENIIELKLTKNFYKPEVIVHFSSISYRVFVTNFWKTAIRPKTVILCTLFTFIAPFSSPVQWWVVIT